MSWSLFKDNVAVVTKCLFFTICAFFFGKNAFQAWLVHESGITTTTTTIEPVPAIGKVIHPKYCKNSNESCIFFCFWADLAVRILRKKLLEKMILAFKNGVKSIQTAGYNGARTVA